jgi:hypothetical protein
MAFCEKAIFIWQNEAVGNTARITTLLRDGGFEAAYLHAVRTTDWRTPSRIELAKACREAGIRVYASCGVYGVNPKLEGAQAAAIVNDYALDGFIFDAEVTFDAQPTPDSNAVHLLMEYKRLAEKPCAWCWWSHYKSWSTGVLWHPVKILQAAMQYADVGMPMAYPWGGDSATNAVRFLETCWAQWRAVTDKPIVPAGRAFIGGGGTAQPDALTAFDKRARELGATGLAWWSMQHAIDGTHLPGVWEALSATPGFVHTGESTMWTNNAIGFFTRNADGAAWDNPAFDFVVGYAGGNWTQQSPGVYVMEPNPNLKPIELKTRAKGKTLLMLWDFDVDYYTRGQFGASDQYWPTEDNDYPLKALKAALANRDFDGLIIRVMNRNNMDGKPELMSYVAFAAKKFTERANRWLYTTKGLNKWTFVLTNDEFLRIDGKQEDWYTWTKGWYLGIKQEAVRPLASGAWPQDGDKIRAVPPSLGWKLWHHFDTTTLDMLIWNGTDAEMRDFLKVDETEPEPPQPPTPTTEFVPLSQYNADMAAVTAKLTALSADVAKINAARAVFGKVE